MGSGGDNAGISVICDADGIVVLQTDRAVMAEDATPAVADAWSSDEGRETAVGTPLVKTFWFDHLDCDHKELQQIVRKAASAGKADRVRVWVRVDKHQLIRAELTATPLFNAAGESKQVLVRTEPTRADPRQRGAAAALRKPARTIDDAAPAAEPGVPQIDLLTLRLAVPLVRLETATGTVIGVNDAFAALIGREREACANLPLSELLHVDDRRAASEAFAGVAAAGDRSIDARLIGESREITARLTRTPDPAVEGAALLVVVDRSDERRADDLELANLELAEASAQHARWLSRLDKLIDHAPVGLALFENGQAIRTNPAFERQAADSGGWVDALTHRAAKSRAVAEQQSTRQSITGFWLGEEAESGTTANLVGATIAPAPAPALEAERRLEATLKAMTQSERVAAALIEVDGSVTTLGPALAAVLGGPVPAQLDELVAEDSLGEARSALAQVRSSRSTVSTRLALRNRGGTFDVTLAPCDGAQDVLALFEDSSEAAVQLESLRGRLALQHETIERLEVAAAEAAEAQRLRAREAEREAQSQRLFDAFAGGAMSWDVDEGRIEADARARELLHCEADAELTPATLLAAASEQDRESFERALFDAMSPEGDGALDTLVHCGPDASPVRIVGNVLFEEHDGSRDPSRFVGGVVDVSESRRAESRVAELTALLQLRTAELNAIFECAPDAVRITTNGTLRHNAAAASLFADHIDSMFNGDGTAPPALALAGKTAAAVVPLSEGTDGAAGRFVLSSAAPVISNGEVVGAVSVDRDVTEQRQLEVELRYRDEQIAGLFQNTGVGLAYVDAAGILLDANPQLSVLLGHSRTDLVGKPIGTLAIDADRATLAGQLEAVLSGELTSCSSEVRLSRRGGDVCWVQLTIAPRHGNGDPSVVAIFQDVNELRIERERRAEAAAALAQVRERYDLLASTIGEGFLLLDASLRIVEANPAAIKLLNLTSGFEGAAFDHLTFASPETGTTVTSRLPWQRAARGKATSGELVVRVADNASDAGRTLEFSASPAAGRNIAVNVRDVTSRHAMQEDLQKAYARVVEAHTLLQQRTQQWEGNFLSAVNQLGAATASAAPLARSIAADARLPADLRAAAQRMADAFRVHDRLVKHYADVPGVSTLGGRSGSGGRPVPTLREEVDVQALAEDAMRLVMARFNVAGRMTTRFAAKTAVCSVDAALVRHALWSLFAFAASNATKAGARVEVSDVASAGAPPRLRLVVGWPGKHGKAPELALASSLIESEGGTFEALVEDDSTVATIEFEVITATPREAKREDATRTRVLLVEDHDSTARVLSRQLARLRCEVTLATTLTEAESILGASGGTIELIVCDVTMPDGNAAEFVARANATRAAAKRPPLPAIALRGYGGDHDPRTLKAAGFVDQLIKPVDLSALSSAINKIAGKGGTFARSAGVIE